MNTPQNKNTLRAALKNIRKNISYEKREQLNKSAHNNLIKFIENQSQFRPIEHIAIFNSFEDEIDTLTTINYLLSQNKQVYLPIIHPFTQKHLIFQTFKPNIPLTKNKYSIIEPKLNVTNIILKDALDLIIVPLTGFDKSGNRLGMGGGFYDRTFESYAYPEKLVGFAYSFQRTDCIPTEPWDLKLSAIITD